MANSSKSGQRWLKNKTLSLFSSSPFASSYSPLFAFILFALAERSFYVVCQLRVIKKKQKQKQPANNYNNYSTVCMQHATLGGRSAGTLG